MSEQAALKLRNRNPDVLTCIANLSNDEVFTPPEIANQMLDLLAEAWAAENDGANIWANKSLTYLDPFTKSGVFLREITSRLTDGLKDEISDLKERVDHILTRQVFGIGITNLTSLIARRSVYCSKWANGKHSIAASFDIEDGNIWFEPGQHEWVGATEFIETADEQGNPVTKGTNGRCKYCGASQKALDREQGLETHAYTFIHTDDIKARIAELFGDDMQFDVIVGNPPFQLGDGGGGGGASATPIYNLFVERALSLEPRYAVMITPSRWFSGGKGLDSFRDRMLGDRHFVKLVDYPQLYDVFPGVKIRGGVSYWLWSRDHNGDCEVVTKVGSEVIGEPALRSLDAYDVLVRRNEAVRILDRVSSFRVGEQPEASLGDQVSARKPFGLTNQRGKPTAAGIKDPVLVYGNQVTSYMERSAITNNQSWIDQWKVLLVKAHGTSGRDDVTILGEPVVAAPGTACTETYLVIGVCKSETEARNLAAYMRTRFVRFLVSLRKITQNITRDSYRFVPVLPMDRVWTDEDLYERYGIKADEIQFIESLIAERPSDDDGPTEVVEDDE
ncbi:Eco57I restriction-modification methylase domain-containing protein [Mycobacterium asiaticum]|uniref:site-specific DNA-methyltransferase (adenine-specific) n=1 Tax=Mycobacterium asiaticum TaxID=1790 RepID=A0A1A3N948_MYCAS|nr:Eco57I restriction-modification methylase domain-containing protein [Mycobacterium asiaticum]OBK17865.1 restriction endonuclease [Mycobacterium asiaticum]